MESLCIDRMQYRWRNTAYKYTEARPTRVKHLFSAKGFSKWRESGSKNTVGAWITWLAGRLSICILSTEEFITDRIPFRPQTAVVIVRDTGTFEQLACSASISFRDLSTDHRSRSVTSL